MASKALRDLALFVPPIRRLYEAYQRSQAECALLRGQVQQLQAGLSSAADKLLRLQQDHQLSRFGNGELIAEVQRLQAELASARTTTRTPNEAPPHRYMHWDYLKNRNQLIEIDFPVKPKVRHGHGLPPEPLMLQRLNASRDRYEANMKAMLPLLEPMRSIPPHSADDPAEPNWQNLAFPALDAMALYGLIAMRKPRFFLEIGSGFSTKFARRAIKDHRLSTRITSIDPEPRAEVDAICDEVIRKPLEDVDISLFDNLDLDVLIFYDGSHRSFQNSDVTVFFTEILPRLKPGMLFGIHDIFLPDDYPPAWLDWYFNEQYLLACWLLAGDKLAIEFPAAFIGSTRELHFIFDPLWRDPNLAGANHYGGCLFATVR